VSYLPNISLFLIIGSFLLVVVFTVKVCVDDARRRGKSPLLVSLLVLFSFPLGVIIWLLFRPEPLNGASSQQPFRLDDHRLQ
jgi:hypothetical protein